MYSVPEGFPLPALIGHTLLRGADHIRGTDRSDAALKVPVETMPGLHRGVKGTLALASFTDLFDKAQPDDMPSCNRPMASTPSRQTLARHDPLFQPAQSA